jgi:hypothetical protein
MLADELEYLKTQFSDFAPVHSEIVAAPKFLLDEDFAALAASLKPDLPQLVRLLPHARLPFPTCWIEFANEHRQDKLVFNEPLKPGQLTVKRVGYFLRSVRPDLSAWAAYLFRSFAKPFDRHVSTASHGELFDTGSGDVAAAMQKQIQGYFETCEEAALPAALKHSSCPIEPAFGVAEMQARIDQLSDAGKATCAEDWAGEGTFLQACLILLNTKNVVEVLPPADNARLNRARAKNGRPPLFSFYTCRISRDHHAAAAPGSGSVRAALCARQFVRGHFKARKSGVFWWSPHARGDLSRGMVAKDYEVRA